MAEVTKQEMHQQLEACKNKIIERTVSRQEVQTLLETARDRVMNYVHDLVQVHQQNVFRKTGAQQLELSRRIANLEVRLQTVEQDLKLALQYLQLIAEQPRQQVVVKKSDQDEEQTEVQTAEQRYLYNYR